MKNLQNEQLHMYTLDNVIRLIKLGKMNGQESRCWCGVHEKSVHIFSRWARREKATWRT